MLKHESGKTSQLFKTLTRLVQDNTLTRKAFLNAIASVLDYSAKIIVTFVITPFMVSGLGDYFFGTWQFLIRIVGYMSPASGRPTQALKFILAKEQNSSDYALKRSYVGSTFEVLAIFFPLLAIPGAIISWLIPGWLKTPAEYIWDVRIACAVLVLNLILITLVAVPQAVMEGENKSYKRMGLATILVFIGGGLTWLALFLDTGIKGVAIAVVFLSIIQLFFYFSLVRTYSPWFGIARPARETVKEFLKLSGWFMAWNLIIQLMISSDVIVLGLVNSVESVTYYTITKYAPETMVTLISMMVIGVLPGLGGIIGSGDLEKAAQIREEIMALTWLIVTVLGSAVLFWNRTFITLWVGNDYFVGSLTNLVILISIFQFILIRNDANVIDLTLQLKHKVILGAVSVLVSILSAVVFARFLDLQIIGVIFGIIIGRLILTVAYPILIGKLFHINFIRQLKSIIRPAAVTAILFLAACFLEKYLPTQSWQSLSGWAALLLSTILSAGLFLMIAFHLGLSNIQRQRVLQRVRALTPWKGGRDGAGRSD